MECSKEGCDSCYPEACKDEACPSSYHCETVTLTAPESLVVESHHFDKPLILRIKRLEATIVELESKMQIFTDKYAH